MEPKIIYETKDFLIINKPAGLLVHRAANLEEKTLIDWLLKNHPEVKGVGDDPENRPGIVHRLDKDTSGILVIAKNQESFDYLKKLFQKKEAKTTYLALVWGRVLPESGTINKPIGLKAGTVKRTTMLKRVKMVKEAITTYGVKKYFNDFTFLEVAPLTGRTHQIRVHLASIGHPVVGDKLYGNKKIPEGLDRQFLHAESIEFTTQEKERIKVAADLPDDLKNFLNYLESTSKKV